MSDKLEHENETGDHWLSAWASPETKKLELAFLRWVLVWGVSLYLTKNVARWGWVTEPFLWAFPIITVLFSLVMVQRYFRFLIGADELTRKIQLDGIAMAFAVITILVMSLETFESFGAPRLEDNTVVALMGFAWGAAQIWGRWKYR